MDEVCIIWKGQGGQALIVNQKNSPGDLIQEPCFIGCSEWFPPPLLHLGSSLSSCHWCWDNGDCSTNSTTTSLPLPWTTAAIASLHYSSRSSLPKEASLCSFFLPIPDRVTLMEDLIQSFSLVNWWAPFLFISERKRWLLPLSFLSTIFLKVTIYMFCIPKWIFTTGKKPESSIYHGS